MNAPQDSSGEELARGLPQREHLTRALEDCRAAQERTDTELAVALAAAKDAVEEMQHFIYAVSHDLRTPLRSVASYAKLLQRQYAEDQETSELTAFIVDGAAEMNTLIEDLLKYSRAGGTPRRNAIDVGALVQFALMNLQPQIRETGAEITIGKLPTLAVDESQFTQLFQQIIGNALKFRGVEPPRLEVTAAEELEGYVLSVRDNGPGIGPQYQETVFLPFKRLHGRDLPGTGLGLAVCKKILKAHGGKIWVESDGGQGSTFKVFVPF